MTQSSTVDGFVNTDKPRGWTSFQTVKKVKSLSGSRKAGHAGTLDPAAGGVLIILLGEACKTSQIFNSVNKEYRAVIKLGYSSSTLDGEGEITKSKQVTVEPGKAKKIVQDFKGKYVHRVPDYSAKKHRGRTFYDIKRSGGTPPERKQNSEILDIKFLGSTDDEIKISVKCTSGTYIRTLASDIARKFDTLGYLKKLTRTGVGSFKLKDSVSPAEETWKKGFTEMDEGMKLMEHVVINNTAAKKVENGVNFSRSDIIENKMSAEENIFGVFSEEYRLKALAEKVNEKYNLKRVFNR
ncbi:MAG: tRNA pseudouridine(55) synthase TruB [Elusimicrobiota bacterium]